MVVSVSDGAPIILVQTVNTEQRMHHGIYGFQLGTGKDNSGKSVPSTSNFYRLRGDFVFLFEYISDVYSDYRVIRPRGGYYVHTFSTRADAETQIPGDIDSKLDQIVAALTGKESTSTEVVPWYQRMNLMPLIRGLLSRNDEQPYWDVKTNKSYKRTQQALLRAIAENTSAEALSGIGISMRVTQELPK